MLIFSLVSFLRNLGGDRNRYSPEKRCDAKDIKYDKVFFVKFHRSRYFFHFVLEGLVRYVALITDPHYDCDTSTGAYGLIPFSLS